MFKKALLSGAVALALGGAAYADYEDGVRAYDRGNFSRAQQEFSATASSDPRSAYMLGRMYEHGRGLNRSNLQAYRWYDRAADGGHAQAASARDRVQSRMSTRELATVRGEGGGRSSRGSDALALQVEQELQAKGYPVGTVDGDVDARTTTAVRAYQRDAGLSVNGRITTSLLDHLETSQVAAQPQTPEEAARDAFMNLGTRLLQQGQQ